jgi:predicted enzyme related to lactoylglutathione lyase
MINNRYQPDIKNLIQKLKNVSLLVNNYDEAIAFYTQKLSFKVTMDVPYGEKEMYRWITLGLSNENEKEGTEITLALSNSQDSEKMVGKQASDYPLFVLLTDNCQQEYERMKSNGVKFLGEPQQAPYGIGVVFKDLYGNLIYLMDKNTANIGSITNNRAERNQISRSDDIKNNLDQELQNEEREQEQLKIDPEQVLEEEEKIQPKSTMQE